MAARVRVGILDGLQVVNTQIGQFVLVGIMPADDYKLGVDTDLSYESN